MIKKTKKGAKLYILLENGVICAGEVTHINSQVAGLLTYAEWANETGDEKTDDEEVIKNVDLLYDSPDVSINFNSTLPEKLFVSFDAVKKAALAEIEAKQSALIANLRKLNKNVLCLAKTNYKEYNEFFNRLQAQKGEKIGD